MIKRIYTDKEIEKLKQNPFILDIKYKREICYDPIFKLWAVLMKKKYHDLSAKDIFLIAKFDMNILHYKLPQRRILEWTSNFNKFGKWYFISQSCYSSLEEQYDNIVFKKWLNNYINKRIKDYENN